MQNDTYQFSPLLLLPPLLQLLLQSLQSLCKAAPSGGHGCVRLLGLPHPCLHLLEVAAAVVRVLAQQGEPLLLLLRPPAI
eukprot:COSAG05_NODE_1084_length_5930_cov_11.147316_4_plen_80_part_00